jgi:hypothetical protein
MKTYGRPSDSPALDMRVHGPLKADAASVAGVAREPADEVMEW